MIKDFERPIPDVHEVCKKLRASINSTELGKNRRGQVVTSITHLTLSGLACLAFFGGFVWMLLV